MNPREVQEACYRAESEALEGLGRRWRTHREVQTYVESVLSSDYWHDKHPHVGEVHVGQTRSKQWSGMAGKGTIRIGLREERVVLHELAHIAAPAKAGHGSAWQEIYLDLVREFMGFHAYGALQSALAAEGL